MIKPHAAFGLTSYAGGASPSLGQARRLLVAVLVVAVAALTALAPSASAAGRTTLMDVRAGQHPGFDRVVFQFAGPLPNSRAVQYVDQVTDRAGAPKELVGSAFLLVSMATVYSVDGGRLPSYGAARETYPLPNVIQTVDTRNFEVDAEDGRAIFGIGLARRTPFRVFTLSNPNRLVIDIEAKFRTVPVKVYFLSHDGPLRLTAVTRPVIPPAVATGALQRLFAGPTLAETARSIQFVQGEVAGFTGLTIRDGVASVQLLGRCPSDPDIEDLLFDEVERTLRQFATVRSVQIRC